MCLAHQFITVIIESEQGKEWNWAFLTALGNRLAGLPHNCTLLQKSGLCSLFSRNPAKLADIWCLNLMPLWWDPICTFAEVWCCSEHYLWLWVAFWCQFLGWRHRLQCIVNMRSFLRLLKLHKLVVRKLDLPLNLSKETRSFKCMLFSIRPV